eukprot:307125-Rhodomonas_salina.1
MTLFQVILGDFNYSDLHRVTPPPFAQPQPLHARVHRCARSAVVSASCPHAAMPLARSLAAQTKQNSTAPCTAWHDAGLC